MAIVKLTNTGHESFGRAFSLSASTRLMSVGVVGLNIHSKPAITPRNAIRALAFKAFTGTFQSGVLTRLS